MPLLHCYSGSLSHFADHLAPIWKALPDEVKGGFFARGYAEERARELGIEIAIGEPRRLELVMTASYEDYRAVNPAKVVLVNHGCGQQYGGNQKDVAAATNPSYTGGRDRDRVVLHICPSEADAARNRATGTSAVAAGPCRLDDWYNGVKQRPRNDRSIVAVSFHADVHVVPESRSAFAHYQAELIRLAKNSNVPFDFLGHSHPRWQGFMAKFWKRLGVPYARHFDEVLEKADCYVIDNSSTGPEFASTGRPIVWMSAPFYRREVNHGKRFWEWTEGIPHIDEPEQLLPAIGCALADLPPHRAARERMVQSVYGGLTDGRATSRATAAVVELVNAS